MRHEDLRVVQPVGFFNGTAPSHHKALLKQVPLVAVRDEDVAVVDKASIVIPVQSRSRHPDGRQQGDEALRFALPFNSLSLFSVTSKQMAGNTNWGCTYMIVSSLTYLLYIMKKT